uniref:Uncharacterized protein n=1 Tax=Romanomermis culicivorax TaxID=13658 RepID=A0A915IDZ7_ROMCU
MTNWTICSTSSCNSSNSSLRSLSSLFNDLIRCLSSCIPMTRSPMAPTNAQDSVITGSKVIWAARDVEKAQNELESSSICYCFLSKNKPSLESYVQYIDLSSLKSIEKFADDLKKKESRLNILVLNAAYHGGYRLTEDGFEQTAG